jgi:hypothetical protein
VTIVRAGAAVVIGTLATNETDQAKVNFAIRRLQEEVNANTAVSGDATLAASGALTIANDAVTNAKLANIATQTLKGRSTAGTGDPEDLSVATVLAMLNAGRPAFAAHKNGTNQTIANATFTKVSFGAEVFDIGSNFDLPNAKWTPPAGVVVLAAIIHCNPVNTAAGDLNTIALYKNGAQYRFGQQMPIAIAGGSCIAAAAWIDVANGTDFYEVWCFIGSSAGNKEIGGIASITAFMGALL